MAVTQPQIPTERLRGAISIWLVLCLCMVALMVIIGGLTRLTESGLSIVEWKPITGILPPQNNTEWAQEFAQYKTSPQSQKSFPSMTLHEFKRIYWLEYVHRLLGRCIGTLFLLPLLLFAGLRAITPRQFLVLTAIFALGGAQGIIGWHMVQSGLVDDPHVSPYRLALHLGMGFALFGLLLWQTLTFMRPTLPVGGFELPYPPRWLKLFACGVMALIFLQIIMGALVAGLHAGLTYNTFPLMDGRWIPEGLWPLDSWYRNLCEDVTTAQFMHRLMAYALAAAIPLFWLAGRHNPHIAHLLPVLFSLLVVQFLLGVLTLLFVVPVPLASLHQANALLLFGVTVTILHRLFLPITRMGFEV